MPDEEMLTVEDVAKELKVNPETVRNWIRSGELIALDIAREYRISRRNLNDFLEKRQRPKRKKRRNSDSD
jgi:excisionase family DNA binding protein